MMIYYTTFTGVEQLDLTYLIREGLAFATSSIPGRGWSGSVIRGTYEGLD